MLEMTPEELEESVKKIQKGDAELDEFIEFVVKKNI